MFEKTRNFVRRYGPASAAAVLSAPFLVTPAHAAIDTSAVVSAIGEATAAVAAIAAAVLIVYAGVKAWKMARAAM